MTTKPPFNVRLFIQAVAKRVADTPEHAVEIYALAAERLRREARNPVNAAIALTLSSYASQLEALSAQTIVPPMGLSGDIPPRPAPPQYTKSDLDDIVKSMEESKRGPNGEHLDDLIAAGRLAHMESADAQAESGAAPVSTVPKSALNALSGSTALCQYGGSVTNAASGTSNLSPVSGTTAYQETTVVKWDGAPGEMQMVTIDGWIQTSGGGGATYPTAKTGLNFLSYRPFLHVFFGSSRGAPAEAYVDIGRGSQFSVGTNFLTVNVGMDAPTTAVFNAPGSMYLGASMAFRQANHQAPILRTVYADQVAGSGGNVSFQIPFFASRLESFITQTPANWTIKLLSVAGTILATISASQLAGNAVALPGNGWLISLTNNGATADDAALVFGLTL